MVAVSTRSSLWLGKDHLLSIDSTYFAEEYKRFYFRDIQAITIRTTRRRAILNLVLLFLLLLWLGTLVYAFTVGPAQAGPVVALLPMSFLIIGLALVVNNVLGPTCAVYLRTAVQVEELPSLNRVRRAHQAMTLLRPLIVAAQGELTAEEVSTRMQETNYA